MVKVTQAFAERIADVARLLESDGDDDSVLHRLTRLAIELIPGATAAAVTIMTSDQGYTFAASDARIDGLHRLQFISGQGPLVEVMRHNEARHIRDATTETRWPTFCDAAIDAGFCGYMALPLHTDAEPAGAVSLYSVQAGAFSGVAHDIALLFAAQGGTAVHNAETYVTCRRMADHLQLALQSRAAIDQAKGILHAELGLSPDEAFELLVRTSQDTNQKLRDLAGQLIRDEIDPRQLSERKPSSPARAHRSSHRTSRRAL